MNRDQRIRIVKRGDRGGTAAPAAAGKATAERELRRVVSGWIGEHRRRSEELRMETWRLFGCRPQS
jgi:hypothetical protein